MALCSNNLEALIYIIIIGFALLILNNQFISIIFTTKIYSVKDYI